MTPQPPLLRPSAPRRRLAYLAALCLAAPAASVAVAVPLGAAPLDSSLGPLAVTRMAGGLDEPWSIGFLPDGSFLVTERGGRMTLYAAAGGAGRSVGGLPRVWDEGQGGLLDVMIPRDFATSRRLWLTFATSADGATGGTAIATARLSPDASRLQDLRTVYSAPPTTGGVHFGARLVEATDGSIFATFGERGLGMPAQDPSLPMGKVIHLTATGDPVQTRDGWLAGVHSLGHRNPQGAALDGQGTLWTVEHGAQGGDELNRIEPGRNYGWPVITYGKDYDDSPIGIGTQAPGMEQPVHYWDPSIAPSGLMVYQGAMFPEWQGDVFIGSLKFDLISRLDPDAAYAEERLQNPQTGRVRDIRQGPDGAIWFLSVNDGAAYRISRP